MNICGISDMHGYLDFDITPCDIVIICGDICPLNIQSWSKPCKRWLRDTFIPWCTNLPCDKVIFIGGNHDFFLERHQPKVKELLEGQDKIVYLNCDVYEYKGKKIFGTPWCKPFGNWAFMTSYDEQDKIYEKVLKDIGDIDIIISHDAPYGTSDILLQKDCSWATGSHIGNKSLRKLIETLKPQINLHGHLHSTNHEKEMLDSTEVYNVSLLNENYQMVYKPLYLKIND